MSPRSAAPSKLNAFFDAHFNPRKADMTSHAPVNLRTDGVVNPLQVDGDPKFSWRLEVGSDRLTESTAVIEVVDYAGEPVWTTRLKTEGLPAIRYGGASLKPGSAYSWRVGAVIAQDMHWSEWARFETGVVEELKAARWIGLPVVEGPQEPTRVQYLLRSFTLPGKPTRARVFVAALGWYGIEVNGADVSGNVIAPRFTAFDQRVEYRGYDITSLLSAGANTLGLQLAEGRFRGRNGATAMRGAYGNQLAAKVLIDIETAEGERVVIVTGPEWGGGYGPRIFADPFEGALIDERKPGADFTRGGALDQSVPVEIVAYLTELVAASSEPVRVVATVPAVERKLVNGRLVVDFGQNFVGVTRLSVRAPRPGQEVTITHSELMSADGLVDRMHLDTGGATPNILAIDRFILAGADKTTLEARFTMRGFRFAEIEGLDEDQFDGIEGLVLSADLAFVGEFECSDPRLNRLHENIAWSLRGNFTDAPTDCPTRERSGWTGDAQVFAPAGVLIADLRLFLTDWLRDVVLHQEPSGAVKDIVPRDGAAGEHEFSWVIPGHGAAGWADAITMIPWTLYRHYGDADILQENWPAMVKWVEFCRRRAAENRNPLRDGDAQPHEEFVIDTGFHWGEWLEPGSTLLVGDGTEGAVMAGLMQLSKNPDAEVATAYFAHSAHLLAQIASVLGKQEEADQYEKLWLNVRDAYRSEFLDATGTPKTISQAKLVRPLQFGLVPDGARDRVAARLVEEVRANGNHVGTGFLSTGYLLPCLSSCGYQDVALDILFQTEKPGWLNQVDEGATTIWESWDAHGSRNHYALGAVARWLYEGLAGLQAQGPGWSRAMIHPVLTDRLDFVRAATDTPYGRIAVRWCRTSDGVDIAVDIPPGITATLLAPSGARFETGAEEIVLAAGASTWRCIEQKATAGRVS